MPGELGAAAAALPGVSESLPPGWAMVRLSDLAHERGRYGCNAPAQPYHASLPRYVRITDIDDSGKLRPDSWASIDEDLARPYLLRPGDLLFARSGATAGKTYLYDERDGVCAHAGYLVRFALRTDLCVPAFVAQWTRSSGYRSWLRGTLRRTAQPNVNAVELARLPVPLPPLEEQRVIAEVLRACDEVIDRSARIIEQLGLVLVSMLRDLLTRGVTLEGRLRDPDAEPDQYHDTPLGRLPRTWEVLPMGKLLADVQPAMRSGPFGSALRKSELVPAGVPLLGIDNVHVDRFVRTYRRFVRPDRAARLRRYLVRPGDVLVTVMGTVGRSCVVPSDIGEALSSKHIWALTLDPGRYLPLLASLQLNHAPWVQEHFAREGQGGTMTAIRSNTLRTTLLPVPPILEQRCMANRIGRLRDRVAAERALLARRERLRERLREDLVTGRVRISDPAEFADFAAAAEAASAEEPATP